MPRNEIGRQGVERKEADFCNLKIVFSAECKVGGEEKNIVVAFPFLEVSIRADQTLNCLM